MFYGKKQTIKIFIQQNDIPKCMKSYTPVFIVFYCAIKKNSGL